MKKILLLLTVALAAAGAAMAGEMPQGWTPPKPSAELERIKALSGTWTGTSLGHEGEKPVTVTYQITSGGSAVVETIDPGGPHEMVSVYHDKAGKLAMEHYCMLGNQPQLVLNHSSDVSIALDLSPESQALLGKEMHMHSLTLDMGAGSLTQTWTAREPDGKEQPPTVFKLKKAA